MAAQQQSVLSDRPDGCGFYYGFKRGDYRQINVRPEEIIFGDGPIVVWVAYVGGDKIGHRTNLPAAEQAALDWIAANPPEA